MKQKQCYRTKARNYLSYLLLLSATIPLPSWAEEVISSNFDKTTKSLSLSWSGDMKASYKTKKRDVILRFTDALEASSLEVLLNDKQFEDITYGYDTIVITPKIDTDLTVAIHDKRVEIIVSDSKNEETLGLTLTRVRLQFERGHVGQALQHINMLEKQNPENISVLETKADIKNRIGRWKEAIKIYDHILEISSGRNDITKARQEIIQEHGRFVDIEVEGRDTGDDRTEFFTRLHGYTPVNNHVSLGLKLERNDLDADIVQRTIDGVTTGVDDDFYRGEAYLHFIRDNNDIAKISLFAGEGNLGVGGSYTLLDNYGSTALGLEVNAPNWDFVEGVTAEGTRDRVYLARTLFFTPRLEAGGTIGANQYSAESASNVATSVTLDANAIYSLPSSHRVASFLGRDARLSIRYSLDAEYVEDVDSKIGVGGAFFPVPITTREVHTLALYVGKQIAKPVWLEVFGGYAVDRLGEDGINYGTDIFVDVTKKTQFRASYTHSVSTERTGEKLDTLIAGVHVKF